MVGSVCRNVNKLQLQITYYFKVAGRRLDQTISSGTKLHSKLRSREGLICKL